MKMDAVSVLLQFLGVVILIFSIKKKQPQEEITLISREDSFVIRGWASLVIVMFHCPAENVWNNMLGNILAPFLVFMYSYFAAYGVSKSFLNKNHYCRKLLVRILHTILIAIIIALLKFVICGEWRSGGFVWINVLLLYYILAVVCYGLINKRKEQILFCVWLIYCVLSILLLIGWGAQSLGFLYGILFAKYESKIIECVKKYKIILSVGFAVVLIPFCLLYLRSHSFDLNIKSSIYRAVIVSCEFAIYVIISVYFKFHNKLLSFWGKRGIYIFLVHGMAITMLKNNISGGVLQIAVVVMTLIIAELIYQIDRYISVMIRKLS